MKKITLLFLAFTVGLFTVNAQYAFPPIAGPANVAAGAPVTIDLNDVANTAGVTAGQYASFTITADWVAGGGGPWSIEAEMQVTTTAGVADVDPPSAGGATSGAATTLTFSSGLAGIYDPSVDGALSITLGQSFGGSDANWSNISVTLEPFALPTIAGTLNVSGCLDSDTYTAAYDASSSGIVWVEVVYDGNCSALIADTEGSDFDTEVGLYDVNGNLIGSDDDGGTGTLSLFNAPGLAAGTYYIAAGRFNVTFGSFFGVTTSNTTQTGTLSLTASTPPPPPPTTVGTLTLAGCGDLDTYNNPAFDAAVDGVVWIQLDYDGACFAGTIDTEGSDFDTEIGLYDSNGLRIGNNDDGGTGTLSSFTEAGLAAGTYYIAAGGFNMVFNATDFDVTTTSTGSGNLVVNASTPVIPPAPTTVATLTLADCDAIDTYNNAAFDAAVDGVVWIQLDFDGVCFEATIDTEGSGFDTEIGLYDSNGLRVGNDDDSGTGTLSSFTEVGLAAGTYYIAVGGFNVVFNATDFDVTTTSSLTGSLVVNASTPTINTVDFCNLQFPSSGAITTGDNFDTFAQVFEAGVTEPAGQGPNIEAWIGYNTTDATTTADFETGWTWVPATYNVDNGNNDEYTAEIGSGLAAGTYFYVSRFNIDDIDGGEFTYGGINPGGSDGNFWDGVNFVSGQLTVTDPPPPANDDCVNAETIVCGGQYTGDTTFATPEDPDPGTCGTSAGTAGAVWYTFTGANSGDAGAAIGSVGDEVTFDLSLSTFDTKIRVFEGACGALTCVDGDDDDGPGTTSLLSVSTVVGTEYYVLVHGFAGNSGVYTMDVSCVAPCTADAGTLTADATPVALSGGTATISASVDTAPVVPAGYSTLYVLTSGAGLLIEQADAVASFDVTVAGDYTIHTLVYDPNTLDPGSLPAGATGFDVNALLIQGGGSICGALDVTGAPITVLDECLADAGTLTADATPVALVGGTATISATVDTAPTVPAGYSTLYVLTSGAGLLIEQADAAASFDVTVAGDYTIHTLVYDPNTLDPGSLPAGATGFDVNALLIQGGGSICGALDVTGAPITVDEELSIDEENAAAFTFFPNPVKNTLTLNAQNTIEDVTMYNMLGQVVLKATPNTISSDLDTSRLQAGSYFVRVTIANVTKTVRVIKE